MKKKLFLTLTLLFILSIYSFSQGMPPKLFGNKLSWSDRENINKQEFSIKEKNLISGDIAAWEKMNLRSKLLSDAGLNTDTKSLNIDEVKKTLNPPDKKKSILLGIGLSALLPGAGELYGGNILKAAIFLGIEAAGWGFYAFFQNKGNKQEAQYQAYAEANWSINKYASWLVDNGFQGASSINPNETNWETLANEIRACESQNFSHTLPIRYSQQFYELIGKYQNFEAGWTNLEHDPVKDPNSPYWYETYRDPIYLNYAFDRQTANDYYNKGTTAIIVVVLNHVLSAADAAWTVSMFNEKVGMKTGLELRRYYSPYTLNYENVPTFKMQVDF